MKILFIVEASSIHSARWINQLKDLDWDIHIFQGVTPGSYICSELKFGTVYFPQKVKSCDQLIVKTTLPFINSAIAKLSYYFPLLNKVTQSMHELYLKRLIRQLKPDIIHSLGLCINWVNMLKPIFKVRQQLRKSFSAPWIYSSWGADLELFPKISRRHYIDVQKVISGCDYHIAECERDIRLAKKMSFKGKTLDILPAFGGASWIFKKELYDTFPVSSRKILILKGRDCAGPDGDPQGRAMTAMKAFAICQDLLKEYRIIIAQGTSTVLNEAAILSATTNLDIQVLPPLPHDSWLRILSKAKILIAMTISDGLPGTLVETMSLGVFPIHSDLEPIREWIKDGMNGFLIPPEDPKKLATALHKILNNEDLVDQAADYNQRLIKEKLSDSVVRSNVIDMYHNVVKYGPIVPR